MKIEGKGKILKIYIGENDKYKKAPLYHAIVKIAKKEDMSGITVYRGIEGFGANSRIHSTHIFRLSEDLPIILEIVDTPDKIKKFIDILESLQLEGLLITLDDIDIIKYSYSKDN